MAKANHAVPPAKVARAALRTEAPGANADLVNMLPSLRKN
jgi:hypothetical protein